VIVLSEIPTTGKKRRLYQLNPLQVAYNAYLRFGGSDVGDAKQSVAFVRIIDKSLAVQVFLCLVIQKYRQNNLFKPTCQLTLAISALVYTRILPKKHEFE
jgi:hypothetical protein